MSNDAELAGTRLLVTGAGGFVGQHVVRALADCGARVVAMTGPPGCGLRTPEGADDSVELDVCDVDGLRHVMPGCHLVVHAAGPPSVRQSFDQPALFARAHVEGTAAILDAARRSGVLRVVYVSSAEVYGRPQSDYVGEKHPLEARSPYAACKIAAEHLIAAFSCAFDVDAVVLRPFSLYGAGASPHSVVSRIVSMAAKRENILVADLRPVRDYLFITDFASAVVRACKMESAPGVRVFNLGTMRGTSVLNLAESVLATLDIELPITAAPQEKRPGDSDILRLVADNSRARTDLNWTPTVTLDQGLRMLLGDK